MIKLLKYLKPFLLSLILVVSLLFVQAQCELALPDYMSKIVNNGIQNSGIDESQIKVLRDSEYQKLSLFLEHDNITIFEEMYTLTSKHTASSKQLETYPLLEEENLWILTNKNHNQKHLLQEDLSFVMSMVTALESGLIDTNQLPIPENIHIFDFLASMPKEDIATMKTRFKVGIEEMGPIILSGTTASFVRNEYESIGMNMQKIQSDYIIQAGINMLLITLLASFCAVIIGFLAAKIAAGFAKNVREDIFKKVQGFSSNEFNKFSTASLITRTTNDVQQIQGVIVMFLRIVVFAPIMGVGAVIKVLNSNVSLTWIITLIVVIVLGIILTAFTVAMPKFKQSQTLTDKLNLVVRESLSGMLVIRAFNNEQPEEEKFDEVNIDITKVNIFINRIMVVLMPLMNFVLNCGILLLIWFSSTQIDLGNMQVGDLMAYIQYTMQIVMSFLMIAMVSIMLPRASISATRISEVLQTKTEITDPIHPLSFTNSKKGIVEFKNVSFRYPGAEADVLHNISFQTKPGEITSFIGSTGSGKSTIINLIPRFFDVTEGSVLVNGIDVREVAQHELRQRIGFVPQKSTLFNGTIASNLRLGDEEASIETLQIASEIAQASEFINSSVDGYDTFISQGGTNVSGGQKQRLSIARAIVKNPDIYIFDDSFSALDFKTDNLLRTALTKSIKESNSTVFLVGQRVSSIMNSDQIIVLDKGEIVGIGKHHELMKTCNIYQEIAYSQLSKEELDHE